MHTTSEFDRNDVSRPTSAGSNRSRESSSHPTSSSFAETHASWALQFATLSHRTLRNIVRNPFLLLGHVATSVLIGCMPRLLARTLVPLVVRFLFEQSHAAWSDIGCR